jgi:hypothetical protein
MKDAVVHQQVHGYRHGHEMLTSSIRLELDDRETITRLSDLSGSAAGAKMFEPYLTAYPLPSNEYFALAKTWPDSLAKRSGCVLTHTLLVPLESWKKASAISSLKKYFRLPDASNLDEFAKPIGSISWAVPHEQPLNAAFPDHGLEFVSRFFVDGIRPVVWFDERDADNVFWRIYDGVWPELRGALSCCTNSLQPRLLFDQPFDVMFANGNIQSRFRIFSDAHIIANTNRTARSQTAEPWCARWANALFLGRAEDVFSPKTAELFQILGSDPTSISKLFLLDELARRSSDSAMASLGILDLIAALMPDPAANVALKQQIFSESIAAFRAEKSPSEAIRGLRLLLDRWRKTEFGMVRQTVEDEFRDTVAERTTQDVLAAIRASESLMPSSTTVSEPFTEGVIQGVGELAERRPGALIVLRECPVAAPVIVGRKPQVAAAFLHAAHADIDFALESRHLVCRWLEQIAPNDSGNVLRALLPAIKGNDDRELFEHLASGITDDNVSEALDILMHSTKCFTSRGLRDAIAHALSVRLATSVRRWCRNVIGVCSGVSYLAAGTYPRNAEGAGELVSDNRWMGFRAYLWVSFFESFKGGAWPSWATSCVDANPVIVHELVKAAVIDDSIDDTLLSLLSAVPDVPIAGIPECRNAITQLHDSRQLNAVVDCAMRSAIRSYLHGAIESAEYQLWHNESWAREWISNVNPWVIESVVRGATDQPESWGRAWKWLALSGPELYNRSGSIPESIIGILLSSSRGGYTDTVVTSWSEILRRIPASATGSSYLKACSQAVGFAFSNPTLYLAPVVAQSFF